VRRTRLHRPAGLCRRRHRGGADLGLLPGGSLPRLVPRGIGGRDRGSAGHRHVALAQVPAHRRPTGNAVLAAGPRQCVAAQPQGFGADLGHRPRRTDAQQPGGGRLDPALFHLLHRRRGALPDPHDAFRSGVRGRRKARGEEFSQRPGTRLMDFAILADTMGQLLAVTPLTLALWFSAISIGGVISCFVTWGRVCGVWPIERLAAAYIFVFRGSPLLIQMFLLYYGLSQFIEVRQSIFWPVLRDPFNSAVISLALCTGGYTAEIWRGGLQAVPGREIEAARAIGMSGFTLFRRIIAPNALRQALPAYSTEIVLMMKS